MGCRNEITKIKLRTRIGSGWYGLQRINIAVHELGHNTEQTITLLDVDDYA